jgi:CHAT domain-containing protein
LVIAMSRTPGASRLKCAADEAVLVNTSASGQATILQDAEATRDRVLAELPRHAWVHFACHGVPDRRTPSRGRLLLHDHQEAPLTVADVSALDLQGTRVAYLSACETAVVGPRHQDEAIHLASAFQLAGFPHVVSTLWKLPDRGAFRLAKTMYEELGRTEQDGGGEDIARVVHATARRAREEMYPRLPGLWAGIAHVGP